MPGGRTQMNKNGERIRSKFMSKLGFEVAPPPSAYFSSENAPQVTQKWEENHNTGTCNNGIFMPIGRRNWVRQMGATYQDKLKYTSPSTSPTPSSSVMMTMNSSQNTAKCPVNTASTTHAIDDDVYSPHHSMIQNSCKTKNKPRHASALSFDTDVKVVPIPMHSEVSRS